MRLKAYIHNDATYKKAIIYESPGGVYLFLYDTAEGRSSLADYWFESLADAQAYSNETFGLTERNWEIIADPLPGMQHDWERPTRTIRHPDGRIDLVSAEGDRALRDTEPNADYGNSLDTADPALIAEVQVLLQDGRPITAIKYYKEIMSVSLHEAKAAIERLIDQIYQSDK
jgi:hypothetical protein